MKCPLCGFEFNEKQAAKGCAGCGVLKIRNSCGLMKCPNCGYETPPEPKWLKRLLRRKK